MWSLFLIGHLCLSGIWQGLRLRKDTKKIHIKMRLDYVLKYIDTTVGSMVWEGLCDNLKRKIIFAWTPYNFCISSLILKLLNGNVCNLHTANWMRHFWILSNRKKCLWGLNSPQCDHIPYVQHHLVCKDLSNLLTLILHDPTSWIHHTYLSLSSHPHILAVQLLYIIIDPFLFLLVVH